MSGEGESDDSTTIRRKILLSLGSAEAQCD